MLVRIGLIGCGEYCSKVHAPYLSKRKNVQIAALSECPSPGELARRQLQFHIPNTFRGYQEMLSSVELDGAVISTPHAYHFAQAKHCLERGLHVLVDKPPACSAREVQALVDLADSAECLLVVASQRRYDPLFHRLHDAVQNGGLGELRLVSCHYGRSRHAKFARSWRNDPSLSGGGVLFDAGYHVLDSLLWITNRQPVRVHGRLASLAATVETSASLVLEMENNLSANVSVHLEMPQGISREEIGFFGSEKTLLFQSISLPDSTSSAQLIVAQRGHHSCEEINKEVRHDEAPASNFIGAILGQEPVESSGRESIQTVRTIEWIYHELGRNDREINNAAG